MLETSVQYSKQRIECYWTVKIKPVTTNGILRIYRAGCMLLSITDTRP